MHELNDFKVQNSTHQTFEELRGTKWLYRKVSNNSIAKLGHLNPCIFAFLTSVTGAMEDRNSYANREGVLLDK